MTTTNVSRLVLAHPVLGEPGGAGLHAAITAMYKKLGDNISSRIIAYVGLANGATVTLEHDFRVAFADLRYDLFILTGTDPYDLTRVTDSSTPLRSQFTIIANVTNPTTHIDVTNNSGASRDFAVVLEMDPIYIREGDIKDFDVISVPPEDGQAAVYDAASKTWKPGASGDASFKLQAIATNVATIKAGSIILDDGRELYLAADATVNLKTGVNSLGVTSPSASTAYYVYLDLAFLPAQTSVGSADRKVYAITSGTSGQFVVLATSPENTDLARYVPLYAVKTDGSSNYVTTVFSNVAFRRHQMPSVNISPLVYEDSDHSIGSVGSAGQLATYGAVLVGDFAGAASLTSFYSLDTNANDGSANARNLSSVGSPTFVGKGFFGRELVARLDGSSMALSSTSSFFNAGDTDFSVGGWFAADNWQATNQTLIGQGGSATDLGFLITIGGGGTNNIGFFYPTSAVGGAFINVPNNFESGSWHHVALTYTASSDTWAFYVDGQKAGTVVQVNRTITTSAFRVGGRFTTTEWFLAGKTQDVFYTQQVLTDAQMNLLYSKRFKGQQLAGGHVLGTDSFPLVSLSNKAAFFSLASGVNDGSANAKNLTNNNTATFAGSDIFGVAANALKLVGASSQSLSSTDAFFNPGNGKSFAFGGWFAADSWNSGSAQALMSNYTSNTDKGFNLLVGSTGDITAQMTNQATVDDVTLTYSNPKFVNGSWHHFMVSFDYASQVFSLYIDGIVVASTTATNQRTVTSSKFWIGSWFGGTNYFTGRVREAFFAKDVQFNDQDIQKLASSRIDLASTVAVRAQDQNWVVNFISEDGLVVSELSDSALIDKDDTKAWMRFGGASASRINLRLYDGGLGGTSVPVRKYDKTFTSTPATTLAHGLPSMPTDVVVLHNQLADGKFVHVEMDFPVKADDTNIYVDLTSLTIDATHPVRIVASIGVPAIGSPDNALVSSFLTGGVLSQVNLPLLTAVNGTPAAGQFRSNISGRTSMVDVSNDLMPRIGIDRILTQNAVLLANETGPNNEAVYKPVNDRFDQIRFCGIAAPSNDTYGQYITLNGVTTNIIEVVFYGTGLNILTIGVGAAYNAVASVDGAAEGANFFASTIATPLSTRNTSSNIRVNVVAGLTLGLHTVKIRQNSSTAFYIQGFEFLNESANIKVAAGTAMVNGLKRTLASLDSTAHNSGFESGTLGTRGGRVLVYMKSDGTVAKAVTPTNAAQANLSSADHTNEEPVQPIFWREFGAGRSDDLSLINAASNTKAFTLDDGVTTLCISNCGIQNEPEALGPIGSDFMTLTFVGTGLDIIQHDFNNTTESTNTIYVDGVSIGNFSATSTTDRILKVVSGLPYGTHTVKFERTSATTNAFGVKKFIVYAPKKPTLPSGALALGEYFIAGTYVANSTTGVDRISTGILRKQCTREILFNGTWAGPTLDVGNNASGFYVSTSTNGSYIEFYFFGTGFEMRGDTATGYSATNTVSLQALTTGGSLLTLNSANFPGLTTSNYGGMTFTYATGNLADNASNTFGSGFTVSGLTLGFYKVRIANGTSNALHFTCFDVITPVHYPKINDQFIIQNTLTVGSSCVGDLRTLPTAYTAPKVKGFASGISSNPSTSSTNYAPIPDMAFAINVTGKALQLSYFATVRASGGSNNTFFQIYLDGQLVTGVTATWLIDVLNSNNMTMSQGINIPVSPGRHFVYMMWKVSSTTTAQDTTARLFNVTEVE